MTLPKTAIEQLQQYYEKREAMKDLKEIRIERLEMQIAQLVVKLKEKDDRIEQLTQALARKVTVRDGQYQPGQKGHF